MIEKHLCPPLLSPIDAGSYQFATNSHAHRINISSSETKLIIDGKSGWVGTFSRVGWIPAYPLRITHPLKRRAGMTAQFARFTPLGTALMPYFATVSAVNRCPVP